jgi:membrane protease YdiL (CAAX protease family)
VSAPTADPNLGRRWPIRASLGVVVFLPAAATLVWLDLWRSLVPEQEWLAVVGIPAGYLLVAIGTVCTAGARPRAAAVGFVAALIAPARHRPDLVRTAYAAIAASGEELLFRVLGLWLLGNGVTAVAVTSVAFVASHVPGARPDKRFPAALDALLSGVALGILCLAAGGVAAIIAHFVRNVALDSIRLGRARLADRAPRSETEENP